MKDTPNAPPKNANLGGETTIRIKRSQHAQLVQEYGPLGFNNLLSYTTYIFENRDQIMQGINHVQSLPVIAETAQQQPPPQNYNIPQEQTAPNPYKEAYELEVKTNKCLQAAIEEMLEFTVESHAKKGLFNFTSWSREAVENCFAEILRKNGLSY